MRDSSIPTRARTVALIGNPNSGKSTVFNALTGLRQKIANYPGVTVEKREGRASLPDGRQALILDLPGAYSLTPGSPDEQIAVDVLLGRSDHTPAPDIVVCVVDAANLERNLFLASQVIDRGLPVIVALNMVDVAQSRGIHIRAGSLSRQLGVPVLPMVARGGLGLEELKRALAGELPPPARAMQWALPGPVQREFEELVGLLQARGTRTESMAFHEALELLTSDTALEKRMDRYDADLIAHVRKDHQKLDFLGFDRRSVAVSARYDWLRRIVEASTDRVPVGKASAGERLDRVLTHRVGGPAVFLVTMALMFNAVFAWAHAPMDLITSGFDLIGRGLLATLPPGDLRNLLVNGALAGVANVVAFLPQIMLLFFFLGLLEGSGFMARAAYVMDRIMGRVGLHGKSFIPLLSSFACAIPGIMAARTIESRRDRLVTMFVAPFMSCSARLPVYTLLIAAFIPDRMVGPVSLPALVLLGLYMLGLAAALVTAWVLSKTLLRRPSRAFFIELPPLRWPSLKTIVLEMWDRAVVFLRSAGTIILGASIVLWFLASYPKADHLTGSAQLQQSFAGRAGRLIEPVLTPLGFDWKIGIGIIGSLLQREMFVSTLATIYNVQDDPGASGSVLLRDRLRADVDPDTGLPVFTMLTSVCLLIYYVLAMQCLSTLAVMRRETNSWRWPAFQLVYMTGLAYVVTLAVYRIGTATGWGLS